MLIYLIIFCLTQTQTKIMFVAVTKRETKLLSFQILIIIGLNKEILEAFDMIIVRF